MTTPRRPMTAPPAAVHAAPAAVAAAARRPIYLAALAACAGLAAAGGCSFQDPEPFDPAALARAEQTPAADQPRRQLPAISGTLDSPFLPENADPAAEPGRGLQIREDEVEELRRASFPPVPELALPLREVVQRAVVNNFEVKVAGYDPAIEEARVVEADARFDPVFFAETQFQRNNSQINQGSTTFDDTDPFLREDSTDFQNAIGLRQLFRSGGQAELRVENNYLEIGGDRVTLQDTDEVESWEQQVVLRVTQPLLRDFGRGVNEARLVINRDNQRISVLEFRREVERVIREVEETYWRLAQAIEVVEIQEELLDRTITGARQVFGRQGDDVSRVQLAQFNSRVESRRATLIRARAQVRDLSDRLKRLMSDPALPVAGPTVVVPATEPIEQRLTFDLPDLVESAMLNRSELGEQRLRIGSAGTAVRVAESNRLPQLDLVLSAGLQGIGEDYGDAWQEFTEDTNFTGGVGLQFEIPIGNRAANAVYLRAHLQRQQAVAQYEALIQQVAEEVSTSLRGVETAYLEIAAQRQARLAAADALDALEERELGGEPLSPSFINTKLSQQEQLAEAQRAEAAAISDYNVAVADLELAKGTLLRYNNVLLDEADQPMTRRPRPDGALYTPPAEPSEPPATAVPGN